jgi:hypothetical protein
LQVLDLEKLMSTFGMKLEMAEKGAVAGVRADDSPSSAWRKKRPTPTRNNAQAVRHGGNTAKRLRLEVEHYMIHGDPEQDGTANMRMLLAAAIAAAPDAADSNTDNGTPENLQEQLAAAHRKINALEEERNKLKQGLNKALICWYIELIQHGTDRQKEWAAEFLANMAANNHYNQVTIFEMKGYSPLFKLFLEGTTGEQRQQAYLAVRAVEPAAPGAWSAAVKELCRAKTVDKDKDMQALHDRSSLVSRMEEKCREKMMQKTLKRAMQKMYETAADEATKALAEAQKAVQERKAAAKQAAEDKKAA